MPGARVIHIASCPRHGLHGRRGDCNVCGGPVDQMPFVRLEEHQDLQAAARRLLAAIGHFPGVNNPARPLGTFVKELRELL